MSDWKKDKKMLFEMTLLTILAVSQIALFIIFSDYGRIPVLKYVGYFCWALSAVFGWLPIYELKRKGGVARGKSYVRTTKLVTSGVYGIVRHPQFLAGMLLSLSFVLISQHLSVLLLGIPVVVILYNDMFDADRRGIEKFGQAYRIYMKKTPRMNFVLGAIKTLKSKR